WGHGSRAATWGGHESAFRVTDPRPCRAGERRTRRAIAPRRRSRGGHRRAAARADAHRHPRDARDQDPGTPRPRRGQAGRAGPHGAALPLCHGEAPLSPRAAIIVLDGLGVGAAHDTDAYGDTGSNTLGNVIRATPGLRLPNLTALGL